MYVAATVRCLGECCDPLQESGFLAYSEYVPMATDFSEALLLAARTALARLRASPEHANASPEQRRSAENSYIGQIEKMEKELPKINSEHVLVNHCHVLVLVNHCSVNGLCREPVSATHRAIACVSDITGLH